MVNFNSAYKIPQMPDEGVVIPNYTSDLQVLRLSRSFYKKPKNSIVLFLAVVLLVEFIAWVVIPQVKINTYLRYETFFRYFKNFIFGFIAPELCTLAILMYLINQLHRRLKINTVKVKALDIIRYELSFLPLFLLAFFVFFPVTLNVRYLLREFPDYTFDRYILYIYHAFTWDTYFLYLPFVLILGYLLINVSLIKDVINASKRFTAPLQAVSIPSLVPNDFQNNPTSNDLLSDNNFRQSMEVKDQTGDVVLNTEECYYFEIAGKYLNVYHSGGIYHKTQSLSCLENELDPKLFYRVSRQYLINLRFVKSYSYWEKGKYIIHFNTPDSSDIIIPRAQLQSFKDCLENFVLNNN